MATSTLHEYILFEFEDYLRNAAKSAEAKIAWNDFRGARKSIEHVYPQNALDSDWPAFANFNQDQRKFLCHSLGNLAAVSLAKNASLSRKAYAEKVKGTAESPGYSQGSFSELRIAQEAEWTPKQILERGIQMLEFVERRWSVKLGTRAIKVKLLKLEFLEPDPVLEQLLNAE